MNWPLITHLGDAALVLPLLAAAIAGLLFQGAAQRRVALRWTAIAVISLLLVAASKIAFYGWGTGIRRWNLTCFSGHAVSAWLLWPALLMLLAPARQRGVRTALVIAGGTIAALVAASRAPIGAHPVSEVVAGTCLGVVAAGLAVHGLRRHALDLRGAGLLLILLVVLALAAKTGVERPRTERWFQHIGAALAGTEQPVHRATWKAQEVRQ